MEFTGLIITASIILVMVGFFIYKLITDRDSIKDDDPTIMDMLRRIQCMSEEEKMRVNKAIDNGVFDDDDDGST